MRLGEIAEIRSGSLLDRSGADAYYVLVSDVTPRGLRTSHFSDGTLPQKSGAIAALTVGDVVVALRGTSNPAAAVPSLERADRPVFATLDVAVLRLGTHILPAYLAWFLNLPRTQETLATDRSGSAAPRLPLSALKDLHIPVPTPEQQAMIAVVAKEAQRERDLIGNIQQSRQRLLDELLCQAADEGPVPGAYPARANHRSHSVVRLGVHFPTLKIGNVEMAKSMDGRKGGTTHVVPAERGGWDVKQGGAQRASGHYDTKAAAVSAGRESSRARESELKIHNLDGKIAQSDSHGHDPRGVKG